MLQRTAGLRRRPGRFFAWVAAAAALLAVLERGAVALYARLAEPARGASWIWAPDAADEGEPVAFFAVRDFYLDEAGPAWLLLAGDEEYVAYVNGRRVGSGSYRGGAPADLYEVGGDLKAGGNRLAVELRSSRGAGGLMASLRLGKREHVVLRTDGDWRVYRRYEPAILHGWALDGGEPAKVWRRHRGPSPPGEVRPALPLSFPPVAPRRAVGVRPPRAATWDRLSAQRERMPALGSHLVFDWGEEVTGFLHLELFSDGGEPGLLYVGSEPPESRPPPADALILPVPGRRSWTDAHARTFRYAYLVGAAPRKVPEVEVVEPSCAAAFAPPGPWPGVFGIAPPRPDTLAEERVRIRLSTPQSPPP